MDRRRLALVGVFATVLVLLAAGPVAAAHPVRNSGSGALNNTYDMDFDNGVLNASSGHDMQFESVSSNYRLVHPRPGAEILEMGTSMPSYATCSTATLGTSDYKVKNTVGMWFCFKTQPGRFVRFHVDSVDPYPGALHLTWTTWKL